MPAAFDFTRFLVNSITFMSHLDEVSVFFDDKRLARLTKASGSPDNVPLLRGLNGHSPQGIMNVKGIQKTRQSNVSYHSSCCRLTVEYDHSFGYQSRSNALGLLGW